MLHVQEYLRSGGTLQSLHQKYNIGIVSSDVLGVVSLNYQTLSPSDDPLVPECRALFLEKDTWNVVFKSMPGFYSLSDARGAEMIKHFDWDSGRAYEKLDGGLVGMYYYRGEWRVGSKFAPDGGWLAYGINGIEHNMTWKELAIAAMLELGLDWEGFTGQLDTNIYYTFELCSPENRVGVVYDNRKLVLIAAVNKYTLKELDIYTVTCPTLKAEYYQVGSLQDVIEIVTAGKESHEMEGVVICDKNFVRAKVYNPNYIQAMNEFGILSEQQQLSQIVSMNGLSVTYDLYAVLVGGMSAMEVPVDPGPTMLWRILQMCKYIANNYQQKLSGADTDTSVWPYAYEEMAKGLSVTDVMDKAPEDAMLEALRRYEATQGSQT